MLAGFPATLAAILVGKWVASRDAATRPLGLRRALPTARDGRDSALRAAAAGLGMDVASGPLPPPTGASP